MAPGVQSGSCKAPWTMQPEVLVWTPKCGAALVGVAVGKLDVPGGETVMLQPLKPRAKMAIRARIDRYFIQCFAPLLGLQYKPSCVKAMCLQVFLFHPVVNH